MSKTEAKLPMAEPHLPNPGEKTETEATDNTEESNPIRVVIRRPHATPWAVAAVFVTAILAATFLAYTVVYSVPAKVVDTGRETASAVAAQASLLPTRLAAAFKPNVNVSTLVSSGIEHVQGEAHLVVMTAEVDVEIDKSSEKRVLWDALKLGDTTVRLRVRDNKVQYVVPLHDFDSQHVEYSPEMNALLITVPAPNLDTNIVEVQSDPGAMDAQTDVGWGRLKMYSGEYLLEEAKRELRDAVLREGANPLLKEKAKTEAERAVRELFKDWIPNLRENVELKVQFS